MSIYGHNLHLPYTYLATNLRTSKRQVQTQMADILKQIINLKNNSYQKSKEEIIEQLKKSKLKLISVKEKLKCQKNQQAELFNTCRKRVHLDKETCLKKDQLTKQQIMNQFDKQVIQFFACRNRIKEAKIIQKSLKNNYYFDLYVQLYDKAFKISQSISKNDLRPLKDWCYQHSHYLAKIKSSLQFKLISCGFINILNHASSTKAIQFLRKQVVNLSLTENDKQQINRLTFLVLLPQNQSQIEYYTDSQEQNQKKKRITAEKLVNQIQTNLDFINKSDKKQIDKVEKKKQVQSDSSSSSANLNQALIATQQHMRQIYRSIVQIVEGAHGIINTVINSFPLNNSTERPQINLQPHTIEISHPEQHQQMQQIYEQNFDSLSEQEPNQIQVQKVKQIIEQQKQQHKKQFIIQKIEQQEKKQENIQKIKENIKIVIRKNKLEKNNLRSLLEQTKKQFISSFSRIYQISFDSFLDKTLAIGMSVIKTSSCNQSHGFDKIGHKRGNCPTCSKQVQRIIEKIPGTMKNQSSLICRVNGSLMNEINYPIALPNGQIYSVEGLKKNQKNGKYHCLTQNKWFRKEACRKVFLT